MTCHDFSGLVKAIESINKREDTDDRYSGAAWNAMHEECSLTEVIRMWIDGRYEARDLQVKIADLQASVERLTRERDGLVLWRNTSAEWMQEHEIEVLHAQVSGLQQQVRDALGIIQALLDSAHPNPTAHPTMTFAWKKANEFLAAIGPAPGDSLAVQKVLEDTK